MDSFDYVMEHLDPFINKYISTGKSSLGEEDRELLAIWLVDSEVNNGGFDQFYWNSAGDLAKEAIEGFATIGAEERAEIVEAANSHFPGQRPSEDRKERQKQLDLIQSSTGSKLSSLDKEYYASKEDVIELLAEYLKNRE